MSRRIIVTSLADALTVISDRDITIERLTAEVASLKEQLAAREARIGELRITLERARPYLSDHVAMTCADDTVGFGDRIALDKVDAEIIKKDDLAFFLAYLREHEARLLEEMAGKIPDTTYFQEIYALLMNEAKARRQK